jgi:uncharacterized protein YbjT (DUF2867 family)
VIRSHEEDAMIIVFGATGSTGPHLVKTLLAAGQRVRAVARDPGKARRLLGEGAQIVPGDLERPETLAPALAGGDRVYTAVGGATGTPDLVAAESRLIDAARAAGIRHYVKVSGIDSAPDAPARIQQIHGAIERHLVASGLPYTILRPCFFMQNFLGLAPAIRAGALPLPTGEAKGSLIDARDIAEVAARVLLDPGHHGRVYTLTGPEALSHGDVARILTGTLEREVRFLDVPAEAFQQGGVEAGMPPWFADLLTDVYRKVFAVGGAARVTDDVPHLLGRPAGSFATFAREHRPAFH